MVGCHQIGFDPAEWTAEQPFGFFQRGRGTALRALMFDQKTDRAYLPVIWKMVVIFALAWIFHELEALIGKALKGLAIFQYAEPLMTPHMKVSSSPIG
jgi:hypothetical protein